VPEAQTIPVAILDVKVPAAVRLIADGARDLHALRPVLGVECIGIVDPDVSIPGFPFGIDESVWPHPARPFELRSMMTMQLRCTMQNDDGSFQKRSYEKPSWSR